MSLLHLLWSLLPIPIGMFCIFVAWRIPYKENQDENPSTDENRIQISDKELGRFFDEDITEPLPEQRSFYFVILFTGLGIGAILTGLSPFHSIFGLAGRIVFFVTIASSLIAPLIYFKKQKKALIKQVNNEESPSDKTE